MQPYIGITDFTSIDQVRKFLKIREEARETNPRNNFPQLAVGVMATRHTLAEIESEFIDVFPTPQEISQIFRMRHAGILNVLHYADYRDIIPFDDVLTAIETGGQLLHAIQLDMTWPNSSHISRIRRFFPRLDIIIQIGRRAFELVSFDPTKLVKTVDQYPESSRVRFLLDLSMGEGKPLSSKVLLPFIHLLKEKWPLIKLGVAGGLGPETVHLAEDIVQCYSDIGIDAQGQLRRSGNFRDPINWDRAETYFRKALAMYTHCQD